MSRPLRLWLRLRKAPLHRQLALALAASVLLMSLLTAAVSAWQGALQARVTLIGQGLGLAASLAQQSRLALLVEGGENASEAMERALAYPDVLHIELLHTDGARLIARGKAPALAASKPLAEADAPYLEAESAGAWSFVAPVRTEGQAASPFEAERPAELLGFVRVTQGKTALHGLVQRLWLVNGLVALLSAALLIVGLGRLTRRLSRPLAELSAVMANTGQHSAAAPRRARPRGAGDLAHMAKAFNRMMDTLAEREQQLQRQHAELEEHAQLLEQRVDERTASLSQANGELRQTLDSLHEAQRQLVESEKLASLGRLVAGVAHELNTPLGNALTAATALEEQQRELLASFERGDLRRSALLSQLGSGIEGSGLVSRNVQRASDIIRGFKQLAIDQTTEMRREFLADEVLHDVLRTLKPMFRHSPYRIEAELAPELLMDSYPGPLGQVITNIAQNALMHGFADREQGLLTVRCEALGDEHVLISCRDDGIGMDEAVRARVFEAFFTTKFGQGGSGLGMQIVHTLVTGLLGGQVSVDSQPDRGTTVSIRLPRVAPINPA
jgi:two-component system NtrC family sensor kinase